MRVVLLVVSDLMLIRSIFINSFLERTEDLIVANFKDESATRKLAAMSDIYTYEIELELAKFKN
jgi:hypothetical protein